VSRLVYRFARLVALLVACIAVTGCGGDLRRGTAVAQSRLGVLVDEPVSPTDAQPFRFFSPHSIWNRPVPAKALLDPHSAQDVGSLDAEIVGEEQANRGPSINTVSYSVPIYTVPAGQPSVSVTLSQNPPARSLQAAWSAVPLPAAAQPAAGTDGQLVVWQPSSDRMWEFWRLVYGPNGWSASWGGAMQKVSGNPGVYGPRAWHGARPWWGASASSLPIVGGLITLEDLQLGEINHAVALSIPNVRGGVYASPAQRTDGVSDAPNSLPEGAHLRLDPKLNLASLHLPRLTLMIAQAAQRYGIVVRDQAPIVTFFAQDPTPTGADPYAGPTGYFEGEYPFQLLASFPWGRLELLRMSLHRSQPSNKTGLGADLSG
jgi:hypothetical protein